MKRLPAKICLAALLALMSTTGLWARSWQATTHDRLSDGRVVVRTAEAEVRSMPGIILVNVPRPAQIKVFSILGRLVSQETVPAGISQLSLGTHGLYIVKIGDLTCKVAL